MTLDPTHPRAVAGNRERRDAEAEAKASVWIPAETWIVQQEFEDDVGGNRQAEGSRSERRPGAWMA